MGKQKKKCFCRRSLRMVKTCFDKGLTQKSSLTLKDCWAAGSCRLATSRLANIFSNGTIYGHDKKKLKKIEKGGNLAKDFAKVKVAGANKKSHCFFKKIRWYWNYRKSNQARERETQARVESGTNQG